MIKFNRFSLYFAILLQCSILGAIWIPKESFLPTRKTMLFIVSFAALTIGLFAEAFFRYLKEKRMIKTPKEKSNLIELDGFYIFIAFLMQCAIIITVFIPTDIVSLESKSEVFCLFAALTLSYYTDPFYRRWKEKRKNKDAKRQV